MTANFENEISSIMQKCGKFTVRDRKPAVSFINDDSGKKCKQYGALFSCYFKTILRDMKN